MNEINVSLDYKILIIDDTPINIELVQSALQDCNYTFYTATDGMQGLEQAELVVPNLILLDVIMPGMNGFEVCKSLRSKEKLKDIPILFLTGKSEPEDLEQAFLIGGYDYITKPFHSLELKARVQNQLRLLELRNELRGLNQLKDRFISILSHDLRSSVGTLVSFSDLLQDKANLEEDENDKFNVIINQISHFTMEILEDVLTWAQAQQKNTAPSLGPVNLNEALSRTFDGVGIIAKNKGINFKLDVPPALIVQSEVNSLKTIVRNLLSNSIKFTRDKGLIKVRAFEVENQVVLEISDTGRGMSEELAKNLFGKGKVVSEKGTSGEKGTGLGLLLVSQLVDATQATINVESKCDEGTTFSIKLMKI